MTVQIVEVNSCKRNLTAEVPAEEVDQEVDKLAREYAQNAKVPGFRPGKVPLSIIKQRYGNDLRGNATREIIQRCWKEASAEHNLHPLAEPIVKEIENEPGTPLKFLMTFEILPVPEVKDYKGLSISLPSPAVSDENVNKALESLQEQHAQFIPIDNDVARDSHFLTLTIDGQFEGETKPFHEDDVPCILGHPQTNATFSEKLVGARAGEVRSFDVTYPADYQRPRFAGKKVHYTATVKEIKEKQLAELNDEFAKDVGSESLEALRAKIRDELVTQARRSAEKKAREELLDSIVQQHSLEIPDCLVQEELEAHARRIANNLAQQGIDVNQTSIDWKKVFEEERPHAEQSVRRSIILDAIARQESIEVTDEEIDLEFRKLSEGTNRSAAALRAQLEKDKRIQSFREHLRQNKALDFIYRNANISGG